MLCIKAESGQWGFSKKKFMLSCPNREGHWSVFVALLRRHPCADRNLSGYLCVAFLKVSPLFPSKV